MKTKILKIASLIMVLITTTVVYAYDYIPDEYTDFSCPPAYVWNEIKGQCTPRSEVKGPIPSVLMEKKGNVVIICYEKENSQCIVKKLGYTFTATRSENNTKVKF